MGSIDVSITFKKNYDFRFMLDDLEKQRGRILEKGGIYMFWEGNGVPLYVGISNNLYRRITSYTTDQQARSPNNKEIVTYLQNTPGIYVTILFENELWIREIAETFLIREIKPKFNKAKRDNAHSNVDFIETAKDTLKLNGHMKEEELREVLIAIEEEGVVDKVMRMPSFCVKINAFYTEGSFVNKDFIYKKSIEAIKKELEHNETTSLVKCIPFNMFKRLASSNIFLEKLAENDIAYLKRYTVTSKSRESQVI